MELSLVKLYNINHQPLTNSSNELRYGPKKKSIFYCAEMFSPIWQTPYLNAGMQIMQKRDAKYISSKKM